MDIGKWDGPKVRMNVEVLPGGVVRGKGRWDSWAGTWTARGATTADLTYAGHGRMPAACQRFAVETWEESPPEGMAWEVLA
jgi:hypothetical protein